MNKEIECETCIKRKTMYCPNYSECMSTEDKPFYQNRIMVLEENEKLNHYKLLYQKVKERNDKAIEILDRVDYEYSSRTELFNIVLETNEILKGNNETD